MNEVELEAIRARAEAATDGPWATYPAYDHLGVETTDESMIFIESGGVTYAARDEDATFIAHARTDIPALVAEVARLRERLATVPDMVGAAWDDGNGSGLDGWVGPGRGAGEIDAEAVRARDRVVRRADRRDVLMGWAVGGDTARRRHIGYGVPATCDQPDCGKSIDRGLSYRCGDINSDVDRGCGLFFCDEHLTTFMEDDDQGGEWVCARCGSGEAPFEPTPDTAEWAEHVLTDESWSRWREENPDWAADLGRVLADSSMSG